MEGAPSPVVEKKNFINDEVKEALSHIRDATSPDFSLYFIGLFILSTFIHESHTTGFVILFSGWILIQLVTHVLDEDFNSNLFWNIFSLLGNVIFYLFIGYCWSMVKLYIDIWQHHLPIELNNSIYKCFSDTGKEGCTIQILGELKWYVVKWITTWPFSLAYTLSRDPLKIATDAIYEFGKQRYIYIIKSAISSGNQTIITPLWFLLMFLSYLIIGWVWSHVKLFFDVWQGTLPSNFNKEASEINNDQKMYAFVIRIKKLVVSWNILWPFSIVYTLLRHPLRMLADVIYAFSIKSYIWITRKALAMK